MNVTRQTKTWCKATQIETNEYCGLPNGRLITLGIFEQEKMSAINTICKSMSMTPEQWSFTIRVQTRRACAFYYQERYLYVHACLSLWEDSFQVYDPFENPLSINQKTFHLCLNMKVPYCSNVWQLSFFTIIEKKIA